MILAHSPQTQWIEQLEHQTYPVLTRSKAPNPSKAPKTQVQPTTTHSLLCAERVPRSEVLTSPPFSQKRPDHTVMGRAPNKRDHSANPGPKPLEGAAGTVQSRGPKRPNATKKLISAPVTTVAHSVTGLCKLPLTPVGRMYSCGVV